MSKFIDDWLSFTPEQKQEWIDNTIEAMNKGETIVLPFIEDARHGWVAVPRKIISILGIKVSLCSYQQDEVVFLEEDCDYLRFKLGMEAEGRLFRLNPQDDGSTSRIRNFAPYKEDN